MRLSTKASLTSGLLRLHGRRSPDNLKHSIVLGVCKFGSHVRYGATRAPFNFRCSQVPSPAAACSTCCLALLRFSWAALGARWTFSASWGSLVRNREASNAASSTRSDSTHINFVGRATLSWRLASTNSSPVSWSIPHSLSSSACTISDRKRRSILCNLNDYSNYLLKANKSDSGRDHRRTHMILGSSLEELASSGHQVRRAKGRTTVNKESRTRAKCSQSSSEKHLETRKESGPAPGASNGISSPKKGLCGAMRSTTIKIRICTKSSPRARQEPGTEEQKYVITGNLVADAGVTREKTQKDPGSVAGTNS